MPGKRDYDVYSVTYGDGDDVFTAVYRNVVCKRVRASNEQDNSKYELYEFKVNPDAPATPCKRTVTVDDDDNVHVEVSEQDENDVLNSLIDFVVVNGGACHTNIMSVFYERHPTYREVIRKVSRFISKHSKILKFENNSIMISNSIDGMAAITASRKRDDDAVVALSEYVVCAGMPVKHLNGFRASYPQHHDIGDPLTYIKDNVDRFKIENETVAVLSRTSSSSTDSDIMTSMVQYIIDNSSVHVEYLDSFNVKHPQYVDVIGRARDFVNRHSDVFDIHDNMLMLKKNKTENSNVIIKDSDVLLSLIEFVHKHDGHCSMLTLLDYRRQYPAHYALIGRIDRYVTRHSDRN